MKPRLFSSLKNRLQLMIMFAAVFISLLMGGLWMVYDTHLHRSEHERVVKLQAGLLATIVRPAMSFSDSALAEELMTAFTNSPEVTQVALFASDGTLFAHVDIEGLRLKKPVLNAPGVYEYQDSFAMYQAIEMKGNFLGTAMIKSDLQGLQERNEAGALIIGFAVLLSIVLAYLLGLRLQSQVSNPMMRLVELMRQLAVQQDYSLRMKEEGQFEELHALQQGFNMMAEKVEQSFTLIEGQKNSLVEQENRLRLLVETIPLPVAVTRKLDGKVLFANQEALTFFQLEGEELENLSSLMVISQQTRNTILAAIAERGFLSNHEIIAHKHDDSEITMLLSTQPIDFLGEDGLLNVMVDVSERKLVQQRLADHNELLEQAVISRTNELNQAKNEAETASREKSHFLASASHDLRQPLQALTLFLASLRFTLTTEKQRDLLYQAQKSSQSLNELLSALMDVSRLASRKIHTDMKVVQLSSVLKALTTEWEKVANEKGLKLKLCLCHEIYVTTDEVLLTRLLRNLLANAVRYTDSGGILVGCRKRGSLIRIAVWDTGVGLEEKKLHYIFDEFYQVDNPERDREKGLGLGLSIVKGLSEALDHPLYVRSHVGRGSCFAVDVPMVSQDIYSREKEEEKASHGLAGTQALVIDDDRQLLHAMEVNLEQHGIASILAESIEDALLQLTSSQKKPQIVIADYRLREGKNGLMAVEQVRQLFDNSIPAIIVTGDTDKQLSIDVKEAGCFLVYKPVNINRLFFMIESILH